jgi:DNA ligase-1
VKRFTQLFVELDSTNKTAEKVAAMERYFREAPPKDAAWGLFFLSGQRLKRTVKTSVVWACAMEATGLPEWMLSECTEAVGDFSETISLLLPESKDAAERASPPLHEVAEQWIVPLINSDERAARETLLGAWARLTGPERFVFTKLIRGNFRVGVQKALVVRALAHATGIDAAIVAHRMAGTFAPTEAGWAAVVGEGRAEDDAARPYPFCLAHQLDVPLSDLGDLQEWQVEYKWDGTRAQIVRRGDGVAMWSRGEEPIAGQFPEISRAAMVLAPGTVLDGEVLAWRFDPSSRHAERGGTPLSFNALQARLNRKNVQPSLFDADGIVFVAFDVLEEGGVDVRGLPLRERRALLEGIVGRAGPATAGVIRLPPRVEAGTWEEVERSRAAARDTWGAEGLMLKHHGSRYHVGRVSGGTAASVVKAGPEHAGWWKWKVDPYAVDAVLIYAQQGSGRRAGLYTDYTFGVWDGDELTPFAKAYSGLNNEEIARVDAFIRNNTVGRTGPVRMVKPELVFEIAFEGIQESGRHRSGIAVRFPRIARWRTDKKPEQADTIAMVRTLLEDARRRDAGRGSDT